ncbi:MAG: serine hydrolase domain-containing protein [Propionibacteriaceae bacterium]
MLPATDRALLHRVARAQSEGRTPSLVAGVVRAGSLVWSAGRGETAGAPPDADTQYRIGSITKTFVAVAIMRLRDEGRLTLTDPVDVHLSGSAVPRPTIAQLLTHTSGLTAEPPGPWWERTPGVDDLGSRVGDQPDRYVPGTRLHYSNVGFAVLGEIVGRLRGVSCLRVIEAEILAPLGMRRTTAAPVEPYARGWAVHPYADVLLPEPAQDARAMAPAGQLWSTVADLGRWTAFLAGDTGDVLAPDTLAEMQVPGPVDDADTWTTAWGLGLQLRRGTSRLGHRRTVGHGGSMPGFLAAVLAEPATRTGVVAFANATSGPALMTLADDLLDVLATHEPALPPPWRPLAVADHALLELAGAWFWGPAPLIMVLRADRGLELTAPGAGRESRFRPVGTDVWVGLDGYYAGETLRVVRDADGAVAHLDLVTFVLTRQPYDVAADVPGGVDPGGWRGGRS